MKKKVLLVNHVYTALMKEKTLLSRDNFRVFTATTGGDALDTHRREMADAIVMDLNLPDVPGDELCRKIKDDKELGKAAILLATDGTKDEDELCRRSGADGCLVKPLDKDALAEKLAGLLGIPVRQVIRILCKVKLEGKSGTEFFIANTVDVSVTGLLFECEKEIAVGDMVEASFFLPIGKEFKRVVARSEVVRAVETGGRYRRYGVHYTEFKEGGPELVSEFVSTKAGK
jgi:two-component system alkaline phosphatase synthesis response regulator PhoP